MPCSGTQHSSFLSLAMYWTHLGLVPFRIRSAGLPKARGCQALVPDPGLVESYLQESCKDPGIHPLQVIRQILEASVTTNTPIPQMQLHPVFMELHAQVGPVSLSVEGMSRVGCKM